MQQTPTIPQPPPQYTPYVPPEPPTEESPQRGEGLRGIVSTVAILVAAPLIALALTAFVFQSYEVDGPSMETTLQNRDRLIVLKIEQTLGRITNKLHVPERGTIIVFAQNGVVEYGSQQEKQLIKRVIGLPGERVVIEDGKVKIFNAEHPEGYNPDTSGEYPKYTGFTSGRVDLTVPPGEVFVLGDNRSNSLDSRNFGTVAAEDIVGRLAFRIMPLSKAEAY